MKIPTGGELLQFFDYLGLIVFTFIIVDAIIELETEHRTWRTWTRLIIGILGLLVDFYNVAFVKIV